MTVVFAVIGGWLGINAAVLVWATVVAWLHRHEPVYPDVHEMLDRYRQD